MEQNTIIGNNIKAFREKLGLNQESVANFLGVTREMISYYEQGNRNIPTVSISKLANLFGVDEYDLFEPNAEQASANVALAFRINDFNEVDLESMAKFRKIVNNYLGMKRLIANEESDT